MLRDRLSHCMYIPKKFAVEQSTSTEPYSWTLIVHIRYAGAFCENIVRGRTLPVYVSSLR